MVLLDGGDGVVSLPWILLLIVLTTMLIIIQLSKWPLLLLLLIRMILHLATWPSLVAPFMASFSLFWMLIAVCSTRNDGMHTIQFSIHGGGLAQHP